MVVAVAPRQWPHTKPIHRREPKALILFFFFFFFECLLSLKHISTKDLY